MADVIGKQAGDPSPLGEGRNAVPAPIYRYHEISYII